MWWWWSQVLYASFAASCTYPGLELGLFLSLLPLASPAFNMPLAAWLAAAVMPVSLLLGPYLFNPRAFERRQAVSDVGVWARWLVNGGGWAAHHHATVAKKGGSRAYSILLPSKELLLAVPLMVLSHEVVRAHIAPPAHWALLACLLLPLLPFGAIAVAMPAVLLVRRLALRMCARGGSGSGSGDSGGGKGGGGKGGGASGGGGSLAWLVPLLGTLVAGVVTAEGITMARLAPALTAPQWTALLSARYFAWRALMNSLAYIGAAAPPSLRCRCSSAIGRALFEWMGVSVGALAWVSDGLLGLALHAALLAISLLPFAELAHLSCLFHTTSGTLAQVRGPNPLYPRP